MNQPDPAATSAIPSRRRLTDIDMAKGLAISLVVLGHLVSGNPPEGNGWFGHVVAIIYSFHMPFFMYLSGYIMWHTFKSPRSIQDYVSYIRAKAFRLAPAFVVFALVIYSGKTLSNAFVHVDNLPSGNLLQDLLDIIFVPGESVAKTLWFVYVLFEFYLVFPALLVLFRSNASLLVLIGLAVHFIPATRVLMLADMFEYFVYFSIGILLAQNREWYQHNLDKHPKALLCVFVSSLLLIYSSVSYPVAKLVIGVLSIPALHAAVRQLTSSQLRRLLLWLGKYSFPIYLMNTIAIGATKAVILLLSSWDGWNFMWVLPTLLLSGLLLPIAVKRYIFRHVAPLDRITS